MADENKPAQNPVVVPVQGEASASRQEQDINPWSVAGAQGENGEIIAIDYVALCQYVLPSYSLAEQLVALELTRHLILGSGTPRLSTRTYWSASRGLLDTNHIAG